MSITISVCPLHSNCDFYCLSIFILLIIPSLFIILGLHVVRLFTSFFCFMVPCSSICCVTDNSTVSPLRCIADTSTIHPLYYGQPNSRLESLPHRWHSTPFTLPVVERWTSRWEFPVFEKSWWQQVLTSWLLPWTFRWRTRPRLKLVPYSCRRSWIVSSSVTWVGRIEQDSNDGICCSVSEDTAEALY